ncbi:bifunctional folylpolyglutamate synthase/dihydrofolate synthase [Leptospira langatensis]|uniref:Dihydrofolate synthase/folylpolyglutamate synthase n=1 Tax=Leptospira langatensis TaxID=2484983 RepID=A0A5F1ZUS9_9LEPT|nr:cyanophycin synthetase [Leptospira langatensis]TGJ98695.1 bifunctional folylpolyglutamate synthase/dihydrofolate synthase [Leptospira langatensis]TGL40739.1 bifunctional folylpolyglutamate synthase/dihydrofolate synthase [Leptospira langatensis]
MQFPDFLEFGSSLTNLEKTRNFNVFGNYSLEPFRELLDSHDWRERKKPRLRISVVGTNGKGSISHFLAYRFSKLGYSTGLYTSPHLLDPKERIRLGQKFDPVTDADLKEVSEILFSQSTKEELSFLSWFEWFTLGAFVLFEQKDISVQVYEAGLGGRLDATKLCEPDILVVCAIGEDHKAVLGNTKDLILKEKLGILSERTKQVFSFHPGEDLLPILQGECERRKIPLRLFPSLPSGKPYLEHNRGFADLIVKEIYSGILEKDHSISRSLGFSQSDRPTFPAGLTGRGPDNGEIADLPQERTEIPDLPPGRLEIVSKSPMIVYDPAHNPDAIKVTLNSLESLFPQKGYSIIAGFLPDKEGEKMAEEILSFVKRWGTEARFVQGTGFLLPKGFESYGIQSEEISTLVKTLPGDGVLVLGSFRLYTLIKS